jgi:dipeptidyl aminopeptidase/acylaminoacyl peptidase
VLFLLAASAPAAVYRIQTDSGELVITTDNPDVEVVVRQNGKVVRIVDTKTGKEVKLDAGLYELDLKGPAEGLKLSVEKTTIRRGETVLASVTYTGKAPTAEPVPQVKPELLHAIEWQDAEQGFPAHVYQTGISADGKLFFGAGDGGPTGSIRVFEVATGKLVHDLRPGGDAWYSFAAFVPGGKYLAAAYKDDKDLYLWDLGTGKVVRKFTGHTDLGIALAVAPDGRSLLSWSDDRIVRLWEVETGKELRKLEGHTDKAAGVFSPDGKKVLTFSPDKTLRLWDAESGKQLLELKGHEDACTGSFSPDGKQVLSFGADNTIRLWDAASGKEVRRFEGGNVKDGVRGFTAGGRQVAAYCEDQKYRLWDTASGKLLQAIDLTEMGGDRWSMTAAPDGRLGLVNHEDGSVRVFDLATGKEIHRYEGCRKARAFSLQPGRQLRRGGELPRRHVRLPPARQAGEVVRRINAESRDLRSSGSLSLPFPTIAAQPERSPILFPLSAASSVRTAFPSPSSFVS